MFKPSVPKDFVEHRALHRSRPTLTRVLLALWVVAVVCVLVAAAMAHEDARPTQQVAPPVVAKAPAPLLASYRNLALAQGPLNVAAWPLPAYSGTTGAGVPTTGVQAYGWSHANLIGLPGVASAAVQCFAARPAFWDNAPRRHSDYTLGSLPWGYPPPPDGFPGVTGPDAEHFPLSLLVALYDADGATVATPTGPKTAKVVVGPMLRGLGQAHAGMLRKADGNLIGYVFGLRPSHYILRTTVDLGERGLLDPEDLATLRAYIDTRLLPWWEQPSWQLGGGGKGVEGGDSQQWFNGGAWLGPALYDYVRALPPSKVRARHYAVLWTICQQAQLLQAAVPGRACQTERVTSWADLTPEGVTTHDYYGCWSTRMWRVAYAVTGDRKMLAAALEEEARWVGKPEARAWLVDVDGEPMP
jgi:hypothetical protein